MPAVAVSKAADLIGEARALVFDFDGTLVDSNSIKWSAFERCFSDFPDCLGQIMAYCGQYHHTPRWEKFRHVYENILGLPYTPEIETALSKRYVRETTRQIIDAAEVPGATRFLKMVTHGHTTAVLSSTPHEILLEILEARDWLNYFKCVQGAPVDKAKWLREFRTKHGLSEKGVVFFGDTQEDADAARRAGCAFIVVANSSLDGEAMFSITDFAVVAP
jgi:phosphoglycolate phosphatase-like HAD superfamily hydrolase